MQGSSLETTLNQGIYSITILPTGGQVKFGHPVLLVPWNNERLYIEQMADCAARTTPWLNYHPRLFDVVAIAQIYTGSY